MEQRQERKNWDVQAFINDEIAKVKQQVGQGRVLCALSGGVDSAVAAAIVHKAVGDQLTCVFVDHGFMRKNEPQQVEDTFKKQFGMNLIMVDAADRFLAQVEGIADPETKRKRIGHEFIKVFDEEGKKLGKFNFLVQGTIYPDVIESGKNGQGGVKAHHNVGGLPEDMEFELVEPLRELYKDEVREVGRALGLPEVIVGRQPFPGPGLAVRCTGAITKERLEALREADAIVTEEIRKAGLYDSLWQSFAVLPDVRSVGVTNGQRTYAWPIIIRAVVSKDAMTAKWADLPYELLDRISQRITTEVPMVNRVALDITNKPAGTIEWE
jgi:GMP synthase (glutamine-hydrolysing)